MLNNLTIECKIYIKNLTKTIEAAVKQQEAINKLKAEDRFNELNPKLKEIASLRLKYPYRKTTGREW